MAVLSAKLAIVGASSPLGRHLVQAWNGVQAWGGGPLRLVVRETSLLPPGGRGLEMVRADLRRPAAVRRALAGAEAVVWLAHAGGPAEVEVNAAAVAAARETVPGRFVLISSGGSIYGAPASLPVPEEHPLAPLSVYGRAKQAMEAALRGRGVILRPGNIYGREFLRPGGKGAVAAFARALVTGTPVVLAASGLAGRDFVHADDVVRAVRLALETPQEGAVWNVGCGVVSTIRGVLDEVCAILGRRPSAIEERPALPFEVDRIALATARIREWGWTPRFDLITGLREMLQEAAHQAGSSEYGAFPQATSQISAP